MIDWMCTSCNKRWERTSGLKKNTKNFRHASNSSFIGYWKFFTQRHIYTCNVLRSRLFFPFNGAASWKWHHTHTNTRIRLQGKSDEARTKNSESNQVNASYKPLFIFFPVLLPSIDFIEFSDGIYVPLCLLSNVFLCRSSGIWYVVKCGKWLCRRVFLCASLAFITLLSPCLALESINIEENEVISNGIRRSDHMRQPMKTCSTSRMKKWREWKKQR